MKENNEQRRQRKAKEFYDYVDNLDGYELLSEYKTVNEHVLMKHKCGRIYKVRPSHFKTRRQRCKNCNSRKKERVKTKQKFLDLAKEDGYSIIGEYVDTKTKIEVVHDKCGYKYSVNPSNFLMGKRCPSCKNSVGEQKIKRFLTNNNIEYKEQYRISECRNKRPLPFDFGIFINNQLVGLIEYQGIQHYKPNSLFGEESFKQTQIHDKIKRSYCKDNNIPLFEIKYLDINNIDCLLTDILTKLEINI